MKRPVLLEGARVRRKFVLTMFALMVTVAGVFCLNHKVDASFAFPKQQGRDELRLELTSNGFTPSEVQHAPGSFAISVENKTISGEYTLNLRAEDGTLLSEVQVQKGSSAWTVNLQTGRYRLTEINHSQWVCSIVVQ